MHQAQTQIITNNFNPRSPHGERPVLVVSHRGGLNFNPRSPHGERQNRYQVGDIIQIFQSTLPARGATTFAGLMTGVFSFQSTLPARGATVSL